ncbi:uncharacterized protein LOC126906850 [Daktulosphaira vitifoliae]|uniref:uncharacterized protein LOC126906850 n=1 Tax=Daktulosphaira vitifoliae TaxID=58002 RepID=UPI0021AA4807|nr:uncharacterized protein LOC126906850 [Daktulosphaira vitifoliae]
MFPLKLAKFNFLLFSLIFYINAKSDFNDSADKFDILITYSGWNNLNDVIYIKYYSKIHYVQSLIEATKNQYRRNQKIRGLSIYLGCSYTKDLKSLFVVIGNVKTICEKLLKKNDIINACICTEELVYIMSLLFVPMVTSMKGAMDALDLLHEMPWANCDRNLFSVAKVLGTIENIHEQFYERSLSRKDISTYIWTLNTVEHFEKIIEKLFLESNPHCEYLPYDTNYLWNKWIQEYKNIIGQGIKLVFIKFITRKIKYYVREVIIEKYFQLGFKFDPITEETFIAKETIELDLRFKATDEVVPVPIQIENH